jgi:50S ribosomal protein L16 3-hydroxylase
MPRATPSTLPGGMSAQRFLAQHWQRRPLLVRGATPGNAGPLTRARLFALAARDDVESRLVVRTRNRYTLDHGPFRARDLARLGPRDWTLLVQGVNLVDAGADALLRRFAFIPYARLDDVMVSYAVPGGGVGPHFDSYDVFLLQGFGRRRWRYGRQRDLALRRGLPVKILQRFRPSHDAVLAPGDLLYLPPAHAHDGVALDACTTYSIGFRAPTHQELVEGFLDHLRDTLRVPGRYADRGLRATMHPARIGAGAVERLGAPLARIRWRRRDVERFIGEYLSEPKPQVSFAPPSRALSARAFATRCAEGGVALDPRTQLLYDARDAYLNGERVDVPREVRDALRRLADARRLDAAGWRAAPAALRNVLHDWYLHGYVEPVEPPAR